MAEEDGNPKQVFEEVVFTIIEGPKLSPSEAEELATLLIDRGAEERSVKKDSQGLPQYALDEITHIIATDIDFMGYPEVEQANNMAANNIATQVEDRMIAIVTPDWVRASVAKKKTQPARAYNPDPRLFFSGIVATAADLPEGDRDAIYGGIVAMGGQYGSGLSKFTTHLIALNLENERCKQAIAKKLPLKIVLPHWFDDCLKLRRRIDEKPYMLPNPEVEYDLSSDKTPFPEVKLAYTFESSERKPPKLKSTRQFLHEKNIYIAPDVDVHNKLLETLKSSIKDAGGNPVGSIEDANVLVCQWRNGADYVHAMQRGLDVGNLTWLYWMINKAEWASPLKRLLHHPRPIHPVPGMEKMRITVSNYGGDARLYIEALIQACGATFTRNMKQDNTHLITARDNSEKCNAARDWNINMVNHLWLEESYAKYQVQAYTNERFIFFPPRTNLMEVVGKTMIDNATLEQFYLPQSQDEDLISGSDENDHGMSSLKIDASVTSGAPSSAVDNSSATETPKPEKPAGRGRGRPKGPAAQTPVRASSSTMEPSSVMSTGRRAKDKAINALHDTIMPDVLQFEKEKKRKGGVLHGGRRSASPKDDGTKPGSAKKRVLEDDDTTSESDSKAKKQKQKQKKSNIPKPTIFLLVTSHTAWTEDARKEDHDKRILRELGISCIEQPDKLMTHLAAPHVVRTQKFISSIAYAPIMVNSQWIQDCIDQKEVLDTKPYPLKLDKTSDKNTKLNLNKSLERAKQNDRKLLEGFTIYITPKVTGGFETMKGITEANGGGAIAFKAARNNSIPPYDEEIHPDNRLVLLSTKSEGNLHKAFIQMAKQCNWEPQVLQTDWLLDAAMNQTISWQNDYYL